MIGSVLQWRKERQQEMKSTKLLAQQLHPLFAMAHQDGYSYFMKLFVVLLSLELYYCTVYFALWTSLHVNEQNTSLHFRPEKAYM